MSAEFLMVGDEVVVTIPEENRSWGYNPYPDGTKATIVGFSEIFYGRIHCYGIKPGVYVNRTQVRIRLRNGDERVECGHWLKLSDGTEYERRVAHFRDMQKQSRGSLRSHNFLRNLPETPLWEGDIVRLPNYRVTPGEVVPPGHDPGVFEIVNIDYPNLLEKGPGDVPFPAYTISRVSGNKSQKKVHAGGVVLLERGLVWQYYHGQRIVFADIEEEAQFFLMLGHIEWVCNPADGLYIWTEQEALVALRDGLIHDFAALSDADKSISAWLFKDSELGQRVARAKLNKMA